MVRRSTTSATRTPIQLTRALSGCWDIQVFKAALYLIGILCDLCGRQFVLSKMRTRVKLLTNAKPLKTQARDIVR